MPQMSDLTSTHLQLYKPAFPSCGMDCFSPFLIKICRRTEKRWGVLFKCLTTRAVHLDFLPSLSTDSFLMALRRFIAMRGTPAQLRSDRGTNFCGGERELREAYAALAPDLQRHLGHQKILLQSPISPSLWWSLGEGGEICQVSLVHRFGFPISS